MAQATTSSDRFTAANLEMRMSQMGRRNLSFAHRSPEQYP